MHTGITEKLTTDCVSLYNNASLISKVSEMKTDLYCQRQNCSPLNVLFSDASITLIFLGVPPLGVYNQNTVGKNGDFQPLHTKISRKP